MNNELIFFITVLVDLLLVLFAFRQGKAWLIGVIVMNLIMVTCFAAKLVPLFGFVTNAANAYYAAIFLATDALTEHFGKKEGYKSVFIGFMSIAGFVLLGQLTINFSTIEVTEEISRYMGIVFGAAPRIATASMVAYLIAQNFDVWFYHYIQEKTKGKYLWLRNNGSTVTSQLIDSFVFFSIAFYGTMANSDLLEIILTGYLIKLIVAALDTPFIYLTYKLKKSVNRAED